MTSTARLTTPYTADTPIVRLAIQAPGEGRVVIAGVVDSGADCTLLPKSLATIIGTDEDLEPTGGSEGAGAAWIPTWKLPYTLKAQVAAVFAEPRGIEPWGPAFDLDPEFAKETIAMFGRADFFQAFAITFDQALPSGAVFHLDAQASTAT
jgi:hypothetical protein